MAGKSVLDVMQQLLTEWATPREPTYLQEANLNIEMPERCSAEISKGPLLVSDPIPNDLREFWSTFSSAKLFEDVNYGQWGLIIHDHETSLRRTRQLALERPDDAARGDRVIGEFIGDLDQLLVRCNPRESDFGNIVVAIPDGPRGEWYRVADSFLSFLQEYQAYEGQKYWETQFQGRRTEENGAGE